MSVAEHRLQLRAAAVVVHESHVLLHRRASDAFWALPGGQIGPGEDARSALLREVSEELGEVLRCGELLYVIENFFSYSELHHHEVGLYFRARLSNTSGLLDKSIRHKGVEDQKQLEFRWFAQDELWRLDLRPAFLRGAISKTTLRFQHVIQRE